MKRTDKRSKLGTGFTIVELLIVIVVIGILAAITIVAYKGVQDRARYAIVESDFSTLEKAIRLAQINSGTTLVGVTGTFSTGNSCWSKPAGTKLASLARTDQCWVDYFATLSKISTASGMKVSNIIDPWGRSIHD